MHVALFLLVLAVAPPGPRVRVETPVLALEGELLESDERGATMRVGETVVLVPIEEILTVTVVPTSSRPPLKLDRPPFPPAPRLRKPVQPRRTSPPQNILGVEMLLVGPHRTTGVEKSETGERPVDGEVGTTAGARFYFGRSPGRSDAGGNGMILELGAGARFGPFEYRTPTFPRTSYQEGFVGGRAGWFVTLTPFRSPVRIHPFAAVDAALSAPSIRPKRDPATDTESPHYSESVLAVASGQAGLIVNETFTLSASHPLWWADLDSAVERWDRGATIYLGWYASW